MKYIMSKEDLGKLALIKGAVEGRYTVLEVAQRLNLSARRVKQLKKAFRGQGEKAVTRGNSGRRPADYTGEALRAEIITLKKPVIYSGTNFAHFKGLPAEHEQISYTAVSGILKNAGITSKRKHRAEGRRYRRRKRGEAFGETLQAGAAGYDWVEGGKRYALHGFIDGAAGKITGLYFCRNGCLTGGLEVLRQTLAKYGVPLALYAGKAGVFFANAKKQEHRAAEEPPAGKPPGKTRFGSVVEQRLGITMISARTPQAKGRVGRLWGALQDRLPIRLKMQGVTGIEKADRELHRYTAVFNNRFAVQPQTGESAFAPLGASNGPGKLLAARRERAAGSRGCFSFQNFIFQTGSKRPLAKKKIQFLFSRKTGFLALYGGECFPASFLGLKNKGCV
ncbi:MAG: ISNCY family transposase, partial [Treponema sp.]|nr:ISNCY family transposase [Treponema sp.]